MESLPSGKSVWELNQGALDKLLAHLDPDPDQAGDKYINLHTRLTRFFERRMVSSSEEHASNVIDRLARKLHEGETILNTNAYALEVARRYALELTRRPSEVQVEEDWDDVARSNSRLAVEPETEEDGEDKRLGCLERCLEKLSVQEHQMVMGYYQDVKRAKIDNRRELADRLGINMNTLRIRVTRLRMKLEACIMDCEKAGSV